MKRLVMLFLIVISTAVLLSCGTVRHKPYNPDKLPDDNLVTIYVDGTVQVTRIDDRNLSFVSTWRKDHILKIPAGERTLWIHYQNPSWAKGTITSTMPSPYTYVFEQGKTYRIVSIPQGMFAPIEIVEYTPRK